MKSWHYVYWGITALTLSLWGCGTDASALFSADKKSDSVFPGRQDDESDTGVSPVDPGDLILDDAQVIDAADLADPDAFNGEEAADQPQRVIVKFRPGSAANQRAALHRRNGHRVDRVIPQLDMHAVTVPPGKTVEEVMARYERHPLVEFVEAEVVHQPTAEPNDIYFHSQGYLKTTPCNRTTCWDGMDAERAWDITPGSTVVPIGVVDTGLDTQHYEFVERIRRGEIWGWDFLDGDPDFYDTGGHGTAVGGVIGAESNNEVGIAGASWQNPLVPMRSGFGFDAEEAVIWAADNGVRVINMSFGGYIRTSSWEATCQYAFDRGVVLVGAAGNDGVEWPFYPAAYPTVLAVTGIKPVVDSDGSVVWAPIDLNWGEWIDLSAPGSGVYSTFRDGTDNDGDGIGTIGGTSIAAPFVAAAAGLVLSVNPDLTPQCVMDLLRQTADDIWDPGFDVDTGYGKVNYYKAVLAALDWPCDSEPDTTAPTVAIVDPDDGAQVGGGIIVVADASDDRGVSRVDLYCGENFVGSDSVSPHEWTVDTTVLPDGEHAFWAVAFDSAGNRGESDPVVVTIDNADVTPPVVDIVNPLDGETLSGEVKVSASATDDKGVERVDLYLNTTLLRSDSTAPYEWSVDTTVYADGEHTFSAAAYDAAGNRGDSAPVTVTISNRSSCVCPTDCSTPADAEISGETCGDAIDNDCDGVIDCADPDCETDPACGTNSTPTCNDDGICESGENCVDCPSDCFSGNGATCGNGVCEAGNGEDCMTCPADCAGQQDGKPEQRYCCGGGGGTNPVGCSDTRCTSAGYACTSSAVADSCCGDGVCNGIETGCNCPIDCGQPDPSEAAGSTCRDGLDNDCDGLLDCDDPDCAGDSNCPQCNNDGVCDPGEDCRTCPNDCSGKHAGKSGNSYCCGDGFLAPAEGDGSICDGNP